MKPRHLALGALGEACAANFLQKQGYRILARNWRYGHLEVDLICSFGDQIIFVEIKTRRTDKYGGAVAAICLTKRLRLIRAAQAWLNLTGCWDASCRFDVICLTGQPDDFRMEHYPNAFELSETLDCSHTNWKY